MWSLGSSSDDHKDLKAIVRGCSTSNHADYGSHDPDTWVFLQEAHDRVKGKHARNWHENGHSREARGGREAIPRSGMKVPFEVRTNPQNGLRQLAVTRDIPRGFTLWEPIHYETFRTEHEYLDFLKELPHHLRCDALSWTHASWMDKELYVDITLDEGTFIQESTRAEDINIDIECVALRDIKAGEFIYTNHTDYLLPPSASSTSSSSSMPHREVGVEWFDDIRSIAWKRSGLGMGRRERRHNHSDEQRSESIVPSVLALSVLCYVAAKFWRNSSASQNSASSFHNHYRSSSSSNNGNSFNYGLASFFSNAQKNKLA